MKGIAIQTILLLLVGILVVGILVYLVYNYTRNQTLSEAECKSRINNLCMDCQIRSWGSWPDTSDPDPWPSPPPATFGEKNKEFYKKAWECANQFPDTFGDFAEGGVWTCTRMETPCKRFGYT